MQFKNHAEKDFWQAVFLKLSAMYTTKDAAYKVVCWN